MVEHLAGGEAWGALRFWSYFGETDGVIIFVPDYEPLDVPDAWRPEYELMAPLSDRRQLIWKSTDLVIKPQAAHHRARVTASRSQPTCRPGPAERPDHETLKL